jgi:hypothetical protein
LFFFTLLKETISHICEYAEVGITVRGIYVAPGREPPVGERKLFLAIESVNERGLALAKSEIIRLIKEEISKLVSFFVLIGKFFLIWIYFFFFKVKSCCTIIK